jgi:glutathione S-transferase
MIDGSEPVASEFAALWPIQRFPVIVDDDRFVLDRAREAVPKYIARRFAAIPFAWG